MSQSGIKGSDGKGPIKPERAHHCRVCGICQLKFDHQFRINQCVGLRNERYFLLFLFYMSISCGWIVYWGWASFKASVDFTTEDFRYSSLGSGLGYWVTIGIMFGWQFLLVSKGETTVESSDNVSLISWGYGLINALEHSSQIKNRRGDSSKMWTSGNRIDRTESYRWRDPPFMKKTYDPILLTGLEDVPFEAPACPDKNRLLVEFDEIAKARYDPRDFLSPTILISDLHDLPHPGPQRAKLAANMEAHPKIAGINQDLSGVPVQLASHHK
ncbi:hypothetical protein KEM48_002658 [Puccinia striiformis f. sp. tritici PST-130]|nr:hypothetical protein KEM48_002658 [Puccinia striiformis f. sp. tritici PST-130]